MVGGHESRAPKAVEKALFGEPAFGVHDYIAGKVFVQTSQSIADPGSQAWPSRNLTSGLNVGDGRVVIDRFGEGRMHDAEFFDDGCGVRQQFANPNAPVVVLLKGEAVFAGRQRQSAFLVGRHAGDSLSVSNVFGQLLAEHFVHFRFVVPQVVVAWPAAHKQINNARGFGRVMEAFAVSSVGSQQSTA